MPVAQPKILGSDIDRRDRLDMIKERKQSIVKKRVDSLADSILDNQKVSSPYDVSAKFNGLDENLDRLESKVLDYDILRQHPKSNFFKHHSSTEQA